MDLFIFFLFLFSSFNSLSPPRELVRLYSNSNTHAIWKLGFYSLRIIFFPLVLSCLCKNDINTNHTFAFLSESSVSYEFLIRAFCMLHTLSSRSYNLQFLNCIGVTGCKGLQLAKMQFFTLWREYEVFRIVHNYGLVDIKANRVKTDM